MGSPEYSLVVVPTLKYLNGLPGCKAINIRGSVYTERGTPDIIGSYRGQFFALECKKPGGGVLSPMQEVRIRQWRGAGAEVRVIRSPEEAGLMIEELERKRQQKERGANERD